MGYKLSLTQFDKVFASLQNNFEIIAPALMPFQTRHSDQDVYGYRKIESPSEIVLNTKTFFSPKEFIFPVKERLFTFMNDSIHEEEFNFKKQIILMRPCDINGFDRLATVFLGNGEHADSYFKRRLQNISVWMIECTEGFDSCFCVSMNSNTTDNYDVALRFTDENIFAEVKEASFINLFQEYGKHHSFSPEFPDTNKTSVTVPLSRDISPELFNDAFWDEYSSRCIACGRCNTSCVTCSCYTMQDICYDQNKNTGERRRVWDGCHIDGFTKMAGGHEYRAQYGDRMRFKTMHKIYDYHKRFGKQMCVGCGRCDDVCPVYISFSKCINKLSDKTQEEKK